MRNKFTPEQREQIRQENKEGQSIRTLAIKYQVSTRTIWKAVNEEKLEKQRVEAANQKAAAAAVKSEPEVVVTSATSSSTQTVN